MKKKVGAKKLGMKRDPLSSCADRGIRHVKPVSSEGGCGEFHPSVAVMAQGLSS